jgi:hypothetical protein
MRLKMMLQTLPGPFKSEVRPAVMRRIINSMKSNANPAVTAGGSLNATLAKGMMKKPAIIPMGRQLLTGPPNLVHSFSERFRHRRGNVLMAAAIAQAMAPIAHGKIASEADMATPGVFPFSPLNPEKTGHI